MIRNGPSRLRRGFYKIISAASTNSLEVAGTVAKLTPFTGADSQLWKIDQLADGSYRIVSKAAKLALAATVKINPGQWRGAANFLRRRNPAMG